MNEYEQQEIERFFRHGAIMIEEYQEHHEHDAIEDFDVIICTEKGTIAFLLQKKYLLYEMSYHTEFALFQYCTDNQNDWTEKIIWLSEDYWRNQRDGYVLIEDY